MMNSSIQLILDKLMPQQHFNCASVAVMDFKNNKVEKTHWGASDSTLYDLASLTKPLTLASCFHLQPGLYKEEKLFWLLNHRAGLPVGGRLSRNGWKEQILSYPIQKQKSDTYSDYSALRLQLEIEAIFTKPLYKMVSSFWDGGLVHWKDIKDPFLCPVTGQRHGHFIQGEVHDDNAYVLNEQLSHAGLFSNIDSLTKTLFNLFEQTQIKEHLDQAFNSIHDFERFILGWDRVQDPENSLAGVGATPRTFGHLGFTGTSFWCDLEKQKGWVLLTNATQSFWFERSGLRHLRRALGAHIWETD